MASPRQTRAQQKTPLIAVSDKTLPMVEGLKRNNQLEISTSERRLTRKRKSETEHSPRLLRKRPRFVKESTNEAIAKGKESSGRSMASGEKEKPKRQLQQQENKQPSNAAKLKNGRDQQPQSKTRSRKVLTASTSKEVLKPRMTSKSSHKTAAANKFRKDPTCIDKLTTAATSYNIDNSHFFDLKAMKRTTKELMTLNAAMAVTPVEAAKVGYTHEQLKQFLLNSKIADIFSDALQPQSTSQLLLSLISSLYALETVQQDELIDLYHLGIMMQHYEQLDTYCMGYRCQLLEAVCELAFELRPQDAVIIGKNLYDRLVWGTGKARMERVIDMHSSLVLLIKNGDEINHRIAMTILLTTFSKVSGTQIHAFEIDVIMQAFEMAKSVDWEQLARSGCEADLFVLVRSFGLILNTMENRRPHSDWDTQLGSEIHKYFMTVLRSLRMSKNYNFFAMMVERYIAFCVVRGATARAHITEMLSD